MQSLEAASLFSKNTLSHLKAYQYRVSLKFCPYYSNLFSDKTSEVDDADVIL